MRKRKKINNFSEWIYYMLAYALVILIMTKAFDSVYIYPKYSFLVCLLIVVSLKKRVFLDDRPSFDVEHKW